MSGQIDYTTFEKCVQDFYVKSQRLLDDWQIHKSCLGDEKYLVKYVSDSINQKIKREFHVIYNPAYSVPVLYFRLFDLQTGELVWNIESVCPQISKASGGVSQMPHPHLTSNPPFFQIHPCHTVNWMRTMLDDDKNEGKNASSDKNGTVVEESNYLVTWLSFVAPYVGLQMSEKYATRL